MPCHAAECIEQGGLDLSPTPTQRFSFAVARHIPPILLQQTWPLFIKGAAILGGLSLFVPWIPAPISLTSTLGGWETFLWGVMLTVGGIVGLYGMLRDRYLVHIAGLLIIGAPFVVYSWAVLLFRGRGAFFNAFLLFVLGVGCYTRALGMYVAHSTAEQRLDGLHHHRETEIGGAGAHSHTRRSHSHPAGAEHDTIQPAREHAYIQEEPEEVIPPPHDPRDPEHPSNQP